MPACDPFNGTPVRHALLLTQGVEVFHAGSSQHVVFVIEPGVAPLE